MISDEQIVKRIGEILSTADLTVTTTSTIRKQLEQELDIDLSGRKAFVREQVDLYLDFHPHTEPKDEEAQQGEDAEEEAAHEENEEVQGDEDADEEQEEEEQAESKPEEDSKRFKAKLDRVMRESLQKKKKKRAATGGGYTKLCRLSPELAAVMGVKDMARTQVVKSLWAYIRENNLQDPGDKRKILCDNLLEAVFGAKTTDMFKMNKGLTRHLWPLDSLADKGEIRSKRSKKEPEEEEGKLKSKQPKSEKKEAPDKETKKGKGGGFMAPLPLSETLQEFFGTGESELSRSEVVKRIWEYIKGNNLQNPSDKRQILCDSKLKKVFGCESFVGFSMTKHLASHFLKIENAE